MLLFLLNWNSYFAHFCTNRTYEFLSEPKKFYIQRWPEPGLGQEAHAEIQKDSAHSQVSNSARDQLDHQKASQVW